MLVCIPTKGDTGLDDSISEHFGSAPYFVLYNTENDEVQVIANRNAHHDHGTCHPMNQLAHYRIEAIVCGGMGRRAIEALNAEGIRIFAAETNHVGTALEQLKQGKLAEVDPNRACRGYGQHHEHDHDHAWSHQAGRGAGYGQGRGGGRGFGRGTGGGFGHGGGGRGR